MGTWGKLPNQSDSAMDLFGEMYDAVNLRLGFLMATRTRENPASNHMNPYDFAGVVVELLKRGFMVKYKYVSHALDGVRFEREATENGNQSGWDEPEKAIEVMKSLEYDLQDLMNKTMSAHVKQVQQGKIWDSTFNRLVNFKNGNPLSKRGIRILGNTEICQLKENWLETVPRGDLVHEISLKMWNNETIQAQIDYQKPKEPISLIQLVKNIRKFANLIPESDEDYMIQEFLEKKGLEYLLGLRELPSKSY